jgi:hypothetical protein
MDRQTADAVRDKRVALLFFGLLNSFDQVYGKDATSPSIADILRSLGVQFDVFVDTSALHFQKVPAGYEIGEDSPTARALIDRVPANAGGDRHYLVLKDTEASISRRLEDAFRGTEVSVHFDPPDASTWKGEGHLERMIRTFLMRKKRLVQASLRQAERKNAPYDVLIMARPDSVIRVRGGRSRDMDALSALLCADILDASDSSRAGVDPLGFDRKNSDKGIALFKNDLLMGSPEVMVTATRLIDVIDRNGRYYKSYPRPAFRCSACRALFLDSGTDCRACGGVSTVSKVTLWPEYKLAEHLRSSGTPCKPLGITGDVLRLA